MRGQYQTFATYLWNGRHTPQVNLLFYWVICQLTEGREPPLFIGRFLSIFLFHANSDAVGLCKWERRPLTLVGVIFAELVEIIFIISSTGLSANMIFLAVLSWLLFSIVIPPCCVAKAASAIFCSYVDSSMNGVEFHLVGSSCCSLCFYHIKSLSDFIQEMWSDLQKGVLYTHPLFQLCRGITQPEIKLEL